MLACMGAGKLDSERRAVAGPQAMRLNELTAIDALGVRGVSPTPGPIEIGSLAYDSRRVGPGALFFCVEGFQSDGHDFAGQAVASGAVALVVERPLGLGVPEVLVDSARAAMGLLAARFYGDPTAELRVVGVTGTNGKTTTAYLVRALMEAAGERCGLLGTVKSVIAGSERPTDRGSTGSPADRRSDAISLSASQRTTPEAIDLQADFRAMLDGGDRACAMEVSSHALALGRTDGIHFAAAIFTNLSRDHLDFHPTMEDYFQAKRRLFASPDTTGPSRIAVVNVDDPYGRRLAGELPDAVTFALDSPADYRAHDVRVGPGGCRLELQTPGGERSLSLPMPGRFNVSNALAALAAVRSLGWDLDTILAALERGVRVPGRFEPVDEGQGFAALVDYAHTPDSLKNVLSAAREVGRGRVICVFGAGGDRDRGKRPLMGEVAANLADVVLITSDNPRSEDPEAIIAEIMAGAIRAARPPGVSALRIEVDRRAAIEKAVELAREDDVLVIAGKGHEQGQELAGGVKVPFDDVTVVREALGARVG
jgi:UDP-N-acetylmuramoyl-L-alanyl-D-glutamate--2,6-diaminopimelate ligase